MLFKIKNLQSKDIILFLIVISFYFMKPNIHIGFYLKPYMFIALLTFIGLFFQKKIVNNILHFDIVFFVFCIYASSTTLFSIDTNNGIRMALGSFLTFFCYISVKTYLSAPRITLSKIQNAYYYASAFFISTSLIMYANGFISIDGNYHLFEHVRISGILVERAMPRLIGPLQDPNIFSMYASPFFFYLLLKVKKNKLDSFFLLLTTLSIFLTLSRGGIIGIIVSLILFLIFKAISFIYKAKINFKNLVKTLIVLTIFFFIIISMLKHSYFSDFIKNRVNSFSSGSGRFEIWINALFLWSENPIFGIGWYNFLYYNIEFFNRTNYVHNTFLEVLVETGILGFILYSTFHLLILYIIIRLIISNKNYMFLLLSYISIIINLNSLSLVINEFFFLFLIYISLVYFKEVHTKSYRNTLQK